MYKTACLQPVYNEKKSSMKCNMPRVYVTHMAVCTCVDTVNYTVHIR